MKSLYIIQKPQADADMVLQFVSAIAKKYEVYPDSVEALECRLESDDIAQIYSDHLNDDFYPDLEKFMCSEDVVIYSIPMKEIPWDEITAMKKFFRTFMLCEPNTSANHIHIAENDKMNDKIDDVYYSL